MESCLNIFDSDNDGLFGFEDLITLLRSLERLGVVPELNKFRTKNISSPSTDASSKSGEDEISNNTLESTENSDELESISLDNIEYISSKKIAKIAKSMLKDCGLSYKSPLSIEEFTLFMNENVCFKNFILKSLKKDLWSNDSYCSVSKDTAKITPLSDGDKLLDLEHKINKKSRRCESFVYPIGIEGDWFIDGIEKIAIKGNLLKKGRQGGLKKRFFYIRGSLMYYYLDNKSSIPRGIMYLPGKLFKKDMIKGKYWINVYTYDNSFEHKRFVAASKEERDEWYEAMLKGAKNRDITELYSLKETLGVGKFSTVRKGYLKTDDSKMAAIKIISKKNLSQIDKEYIINELSVLKTLNHPSIPKIFGVHETPEKLFIVMELIKGGELFDYLIQAKHLNVEESTKIVYRLASILKYLNELKIMHRDLKCENILISKNGEGKLKKIYLIDFGLAKFLDSRFEVTSKLGTLGYCAPEVILKESYNESVDVWGLGIVYYLLLCGRLPFDTFSF